MRKSLLLSTALVAVFAATQANTQANAYIYVWNEDQGTVNISDETSKDSIVAVPGKISVGADSVFSGNKAEIGGAVAIFKLEGALTIGANTQFLNNEAKYDGGAIGNYGGAVLTDNILFKGNKAQTGSSDSRAIGGGAMSLGVDAQTEINNSIFDSNTSGYNGGAIAMRKTLELNEVAEGNTRNKLNITNSKFTGNKALGTVTDSSDSSILSSGNGGAIANNFATTTVTNTIFENNEAKNFGGAVFNMMYEKLAAGSQSPKEFHTDKGGVIAIADSTFTNNVAGSEGGAVYNMKNAAINFSGNNVFSGNTAGGKANDIHNEGAINVAGDFTLDGGISGDGTITFAKGSNLSVKVNKTAIANNVVNNGATLNMVFDTGFEGEYKLVTGSLDKEFDGYNNNALYNIESSKNGTYQISKKTAQEISEAVSATQNEANVIAALTAQSDTGNAKANIIANSVNDALQSGNKAEIAAAKEAASALAPDVAPVVSQTETTVANQIYSAIGTRLSGGINNANQGISSGDMLDDAAVWVQGLYNKSKLNNTSKAYGYDADTYGAAFGLEKYVTKATKLGAGYAYNSTDIDGHNRDTDVHTNTLFAYGEYKPNNWFVNGIMSYGWSDYKEKKHSVVDVKSKYDVDTFGLQAMTGYDINLPQAFTLTPEAGVRYAHVDQDSYTDDAGQSVKSHKGNIWTGVAGAKLSKAFAADNGMIFKPELRLAATYDLKNDKGNTLVTLANGTSYSVQGTALKRFGVEVGAGVTADLSDNVELSMGYEGRFRSHYQDHTGLINAKYKF